MAYKLIYANKAVKDIRKLDTVAKKRLKKALEKFSLRPFYYAKKLSDAKIGEFRYRVGDYRIIFDIKDKNIIILRIGHRRDIYQ